MSSDFSSDKVVEHFEGAADIYSERKGIVHPKDHEIIEFVGKNLRQNGNILEVGGGSGYLLDLLFEKDDTFKGTNLELAYKAYSSQANPKIGFLGGNALNLPFLDNHFDLVISKNLFHHLVGKTRKTSKKLAINAASEMKRVVRNGGNIIILEEIHQYKVFSGLIFYATRILSMFNFRFDSLGIRPKIIVSFLTPLEVKSMFDTESINIIIEKTTMFALSRAFKFFPLVNRLGNVFVILSFDQK